MVEARAKEKGTEEAVEDFLAERRSLFRRLLALSRRRPKLVAGFAIIALFYLVAVFADFLAPYDYRSQSRRELLAPPTPVHFRDAEGRWHARPFVFARRLADPLERRYVEDEGRVYELQFFTRGYRTSFSD